MKSKLLIPIEILLVENNPGDLILIEKDLKLDKLFNKINVVKDTLEALGYINKKSKNSIPECPDLILINLSMPPEMEAKAIKELIENENCTNAQIIILTNNEVEEDILKNNSFNFRFLRRPFDILNLINTIIQDSNFSISIVRQL